MQTLPQARNTNIVIQEAGQELLIYDLLLNKAFNLNETARIVFNHCDGAVTFEELQSRYNFTAEVIYLALDELQKRNLLEADTDYSSPLINSDRREVIKRIGLTSLTMLPIISSIVAPSAASAASACVNEGGIAPNMVVRIGNFAGCFADCSDPSVTVRCCSNSARPGVVCDPGPPQRTACNCN